MESALSGLMMSVAASVLAGSALLPMKYQNGWRFEHTWLVYSALAYLILPWVVAAATVPGLLGVYTAVGVEPIALVALFGAGWGLAVVLNGYAVTLVGLALSTGVLMGSSIAVGSLAAVALVNPKALLTAEGARLVLINLGLMAGVAVCSWAGMLRERARYRAGLDAASGIARKGVLLCLLAGMLSTLFNVALTYGEVISREAERQGARPAHAANAVWAVAISVGALPSLLWCIWRLTRMAAWTELSRTTPVPNALRCLLMAALWISGTVTYGVAARMMGDAGAAVAWPVYMSGMIVTAAGWGWATGEWRGASGPPAQVMAAGIVMLMVLMFLMGHVRI